MLNRVSPAVFPILSALVEDRAGLHYGSVEAEVFLERVAARAQEAGFDSLLDYYYFLRYDPEGGREFDQLVEHLVVQETFFFRELEPLRRMVNRVIEPLVRAGRRPRVWCAACATGEEPLTFAMLLAEAELLSDVDLIATDISERALARARRCRFGKRALRDTADQRLAARWIREDAGQLCVASELRDSIEWRRLNLCDPQETRSVGGCDLILCRNVLIYFRDDTVARVIGDLSERLRPGGVLLVGVSESLLRFGTSLSCEEADRVFYYRRTA